MKTKTKNRRGKLSDRPIIDAKKLQSLVNQSVARPSSNSYTFPHRINTKTHKRTMTGPLPKRKIKPVFNATPSYVRLKKARFHILRATAEVCVYMFVVCFVI